MSNTHYESRYPVSPVFNLGSHELAAIVRDRCDVVVEYVLESGWVAVPIQPDLEIRGINGILDLKLIAQEASLGNRVRTCQELA